jgi:hypothetical protein
MRVQSHVVLEDGMARVIPQFSRAKVDAAEDFLTRTETASLTKQSSKWKRLSLLLTIGALPIASH